MQIIKYLINRIIIILICVILFILYIVIDRKYYKRNSSSESFEMNKEFNFKNPKLISKQNNLITFINLEVKIKENDIIYCHLDYLEILFRLLKNLQLKNLKKT